MLAKVCSSSVSGIDAHPVEVEVNSGWGDTLIIIVGLPDTAVKESRDRVTTALLNSGFKFPMGRTTINLAPADVKKEGPSFDLPIAIGMLASNEQMVSDQLENFVMVGELALTGALRPVKGVLPIAMRARQDGRTGMLVPSENAAEAAVVAGLNVIPVRDLREAAGFLEGEARISPTRVDVARLFEHRHDEEMDFAEVKGQESVKRALEIAAAGGHNVLTLSAVLQRARFCSSAPCIGSPNVSRGPLVVHSLKSDLRDACLRDKARLAPIEELVEQAFHVRTGEPHLLAPDICPKR